MKNVWCKIFTNPTEQELNDFMHRKDIYDIHIITQKLREQPYRMDNNMSYDSQCIIYIFYIEK